MKLSTLFIVLTVASLALSACGTPSTSGYAPSSGYGNATSPTSAPVVIVPTTAPVVVAPTTAPAANTPASAPAGTEVKVQIANFAFSPSTLEVKVGTTVTWTNADSAPHTVTSDDGSFASNDLNQGASFSFTFTTAGTYAYHCGVHPGMKATVTVTP
jgi:plastocyanin